MKRGHSVAVRMRAFGRLPPNVQGAIWMLFGAVLFSIMSLFIKTLGEEMDSFQIAFMRAFLGLIAILPFALRRGVGALKTKVPFLHIARSVVGVTGMMCIFYSITQLPLADAVALSFTRPLFLILLAVLFLGEVVRWRRWSATAVGFIGVLVMVQSSGDLELASFVALFGALMVACVSVFLKKLSVTESPPTIMFYFGVIASIVSFIPAYFVWRTPTVDELIILGLLAAIGSGGNFCMIRALAIGEATAVTPFDYTRLIFSGILGFLFFAEVPNIWMVVGAGIIVASSLYIIQREAGLGKKDRHDVPDS